MLSFRGGTETNLTGIRTQECVVAFVPVISPQKKILARWGNPTPSSLSLTSEVTVPSVNIPTFLNAILCAVS